MRRSDPPRLHGSYHQWTRKAPGARSITRILGDDQAADYQP